MVGLESNLLDVGSIYDVYGQNDTCESSVEFKKRLKHFPFQVKASFRITQGSTTTAVRSIDFARRGE